MSRTVAILQARMGSQRLPGKVLHNICGEPMIARVVTRVKRAKTLDGVVIATTSDPSDGIIEEFCRSRGYDVFRGSVTDLLDRYYKAALLHKADAVVRITCDCPMIDPEIVDFLVNAYKTGSFNHVTIGLLPRTYPRGLDTEVFAFSALERAWREDRNPTWREHVTPYIFRHPELFSIKHFDAEKDYSQMRWTVDTPEDMTFARRIYEAFGHDRFSWRDVLALLEKNPDWLEINRHVAQKEVG